MTLAEWSEPRLRRIETELGAALPSEEEAPNNLHKAMRYSALAPGKRIRPLLCVAAAEACGSEIEHVLPTACALECIHAFSLIHDDLPALDDDSLRRGRPTCHMAFGEAMAILTGDALFAMAFQLIARNHDRASAEAVVRVLATIAQASGTHGMVGGQVGDLEAEHTDPTAEAVEYIHSHKTGALIYASVVSGGLLADAGQDQLGALSTYGHDIGKAFQIADDLLNVTGDADALGKPVGSDRDRSKATYVAVYGIQGAKQKASDLMTSASASLGGFGRSAEPLRLLARYMVDREQ